jgi:hypothetical protein
VAFPRLRLQELQRLPGLQGLLAAGLSGSDGAGWGQGLAGASAAKELLPIMTALENSPVLCAYGLVR